MLSETLIFIGVGTAYFLLNDESEDEAYRLKYSWIILCCMLLSLAIHAMFFIAFEILLPIYNFLLRRKT